MTADLAAAVRAAIAESPNTAASTASQVMENLAAFQKDPCTSSWYGFVVRLGLLTDASRVRALLGTLDPFPDVTAQALADVGLARGRTTEHETD
jgi:hypothetical protein